MMIFLQKRVSGDVEVAASASDWNSRPMMRHWLMARWMAVRTLMCCVCMLSWTLS